MIGETLTVDRGRTDSRGNRVTTGTHTITGCLSWGTWSRTPGQRADTSKGSVELYVRKGADVQHRDRITRADGQVFAVVSPATWDGLNPLTGHDFGWVVYQLDAANN